MILNKLLTTVLVFVVLSELFAWREEHRKRDDCAVVNYDCDWQKIRPVLVKE